MQQEKLHNLKTFADRLRWVREGMGLSLEAFGAAIGYDKSYLSRLEGGKAANPSADFIESVCNKFMVLRDWLLAGEGVPVMRDAIVKLASEIDSSKVGSKGGQAIAMEAELDTVHVIWLLMKDLPMPERLKKGTELLADPSIKASAKEYWATVFLRAYSDSPPAREWARSPSRIAQDQVAASEDLPSSNPTAPSTRQSQPKLAGK